MQGIFHVQQPLPVPLQHAAHRDAGGPGHHIRDLLLGDPVAQQAFLWLRSRCRLLRCRLRFFIRRLGREFFLEAGDDPVLNLRHAGQIPGPPGRLQVVTGLLQRALQGGGPLQRGLLRFQHLFEVRVTLLQLVDLLVQPVPPLGAGRVFVFLHGLPLDLQLDETPLQFVHLLRFGVDLHADHGGRLVHQVDGLIRQLAVADITLGQPGRGDDGGVGDLHPVVHLIALLQAPQDGDGVFLAGLVHQHLLEAPLQSRVLLHILAVLVQSGGADAVEFTPGQGWLQHVASVHGPLGLAGPYHGVQLIDEQDHRALLFGQLVQHRLQPLLKLAAELGPGDERAHVQGEDALAFEALRHLAVDDALSEALDDGGLADAGLADEDRIVLGAPLQHLHRAADLPVAADDRVQLLLLGPLGHIDAVSAEGLPCVLGPRLRDLGAAPEVLHRVLQRGSRHAEATQQFAKGVFARHGREEHGLTGDETVAFVAGQFLGPIQQPHQILGGRYIPLAVRDFGEVIHQLPQATLQARDIEAGLGQQRPHRAPLLLQHGQQQMGRLDEVVVPGYSQGLGIGQGRLQSACEFLHRHSGSPFPLIWGRRRRFQHRHGLRGDLSNR